MVPLWERAMDMDKEIEKAIHLTQRLRAVMLQAVSLEKEIEELLEEKL